MPSQVAIQAQPLEGKPLNREPTLKELSSSFITDDEAAYDRNHGPIPHLSASTHLVKVDGAVAHPLSLSVQDLRTSFPQHHVVGVLQCAGNRRHTMRTWLDEVDGLDWGDAAIMNCRWSGPRLCDVLKRAGVVEGEGGSQHVAFACHSTETEEDSWYGASIELERAMDRDRDVILALNCNSEPLSPNHGAPVRVIVPGVAGARSVKWLDRITIQPTESSNFYQTRDYKVLPPNVKTAEDAESHWASIPALQDMPINSVILSPRSSETVPAGEVVVSGYAVPGGADGPVTKVEVSVDGQRTWVEARLRGEVSKWSWVLWDVEVRLERGNGYRIFSRAFDAGGNEQVAEAKWNLRGVAYDGYGESRDVTVT